MKNGNSVSKPSDLRSWIEQSIYEGRLRPGDFIDEQMLCKEFNVSRTPVREALLQLASRRLVTFQPRKGAMVTKLSAKQIVAMWEVLTGLEVMCCELAARRMTEAEHQELRRIHEASASCIEANDMAGYTAANRKFHDLIHTGCRNHYLVEQIRDLRLRLRSYGRRPYQRPGGIGRSFDGHARIVEAMLEGDSERAGVAMGEHVSGGLSLLDFLAEASDWTSDTDGGSGHQEESGVGRAAIARHP
jgi:DNA-binding GntR family transcriptional regulator